MKARIYQPARTAMQSGEAKVHQWALDFLPEEAPYVDPLMGWSGMTDMPQEVELHFPTREEAVAYAEKNSIEIVEVAEPHKVKVIKPKSYASNFAFNKVS
jgi:hypothetical protein